MPHQQARPAADGEELDEDISIAGLLAGRGDQTRNGGASQNAEAQEAGTSSR